MNILKLLGRLADLLAPVYSIEMIANQRHYHLKRKSQKKKDMNMSTIKAVLLLLVFGLLLAACSQGAEVPKETPEESVQLEAASSRYTEVWWNKGDLVKTLISESQGFCYLGGMQGNFDADWKYAKVYTSGGYYKLYGYGAEWAGAICVNWSALKTYDLSYEPARWVSEEFSTASSCEIVKNYAWFGDAVTYLTKVGGNFADWGTVFVSQSNKGDTSSSIWVRKDCYPGTVNGTARSMFFGTPHSNDMPQFWNNSVYGLDAYSSGSGDKTIELALSTDAFCYLKSVKGYFNDSGDYVWLRTEQNSAGINVWKLSAYNANYDSSISLDHISAGASCYMLGQF